MTATLDVSDAPVLVDPDATPQSTPVAMPRREQIAFMVFATWSIAGLFLDGWSHRQSKPETFFTPWHALLYSGIAAAVVWGVIDGARQNRRGNPSPGLDVAGARLSIAGLVLFGLAGFGDMVWHHVFGIEADVAALLSPTHLLLMLAGMLAASGPLRAAWTTDTDDSPSLRTFLPVTVSLALTAALASFFTMFASPFLIDNLSMRTEAAQEQGVTAILLATVILITPVVLLLRRWHTPTGTFTIYFAIVGALVAGLEGFTLWPLALPLILTGLVADMLVRRGTSLSVIATVLPVVLWLEYFALFFARGGMAWSAELWTGSVLLAALIGLALAQVARPLQRSAVRISRR